MSRKIRKGDIVMLTAEAGPYHPVDVNNPPSCRCYAGERYTVTHIDYSTLTLMVKGKSCGMGIWAFKLSPEYEKQLGLDAKNRARIASIVCTALDLIDAPIVRLEGVDPNAEWTYH